MTKSLPRLMGATMALTLLCCCWMAASAHAANPRGTASPSRAPASKAAAAATPRQGIRPSRAARAKRAARAPVFSPPGSPPPALVGAAPLPWHDVFAEAGAVASEPIVVSGRTLGDTLGNAGLATFAAGMFSGPHAGLTGLYQTVWHRALSHPMLGAQFFAGSPGYFGRHF